MLKTVIFDVDGTLLDTERIYMEAWVKKGAEFGYDFPRELLEKTRGVTGEVVKKTFMDFYGETFPYEKFRAVRKKWIMKQIASKTPEQLRKPYALQTLQILKDRGYMIAVASSNPYEVVCDRLRFAGLYEFFNGVVCGDMVQRSKPAPDIFLKAAESVGADPGQCVVVGDTPADVLGASAAKMSAILIPDLVPVNEETAALSRYILPDLSQVPEEVEIILSQDDRK